MTIATTQVSGISSVLARIQSLDALIRTVDPTWGGLGGSAATGLSTTAGASALGANGIATFAQALADAGTETSTSASSATPAALATAPAANAATGDTFRSPLPGATLTQPFGPSDLSLEPSATVNGVYYPHFHNGIDLAAPLGTPVLAAAAGRVVQAGVVSDGAVLVTIQHADGSKTRYAHLQPDLPVGVGDTVEAGQTIGAVGMTGNTTGPHLHFDLWRNGVAIDPQPWLDAGRLPGESAPATASASASGINPADGSGTAPATPEVLERFDRIADTIPFGKEIRDAASRANVDPFLLASLVVAESSFDPKSVSWAGAMGLTQLMPETAKSLKVTDPFDPVQNLRGGARYLAGDLRIFGRVDLALAAYQAGKGAVRAAGGVPDYPVTRAYIARILTTWKGYLEKSA